MSTKTTFKRVALVAVAALGLGVLSVAPSNAAAISVTVTPSATTSTIKTGETATISLTVSGILGGAGESLTVVGVRTKGASGTVNFNGTTDSTTTQLRAGSSSGAGAVLASGAYSADGIALDTTTASASGTPVRAVVKANLVNPTTAGTYEVTIYTAAANGSVGTTDIKPFVWTVTVTADSKIADTSSTSTISAGTSNPGTADATVVATSATTGTAAAATIKFVASNATASTADPINVTVAGPGFLVTGTDTTTSMARANATARFVTTGTGATNYVLVYSDGTAGKSTITFTSSLSGAVLATESLTFADKKPSTITVAVKKAYIAAGKTTPKVFSVSVKDSAGNLVTDSTITGTRTDTTTAGKAIATADLTCGSFDTKDLVYYCSATGTSSVAFGAAEYKITATGTDADATAVSAMGSTYYSDIVAASVSITAPATASVGDKVTYTLTLTDKNGKPVADSTYEGAAANQSAALGQFGGILWNTTTVPTYTSAVKPFNAGETVTTVSGVATVDVYVPAVSGTITNTWVLAGKSGAAVGAIADAIAGTTITTTTVVTNPGVDAATDAANEATDAANAATDAALAAADAADAATAAAQDASDAVAALSATVAKLVASLKAQITSLTNLVIKIQKKVKA
ncbi:hypothetical protein A1sIA56_00250 [Candidatus Planktophila sulfonica]|uniref:Uncharacterized protein n=1 Tax=Candidatus Planktophila sulfonica TaxID=1884904 RepID=A0A249KFA1_9ACTN|nr:hypothetical protein [Candidatus Planktophila sulfonica]ASY15379.1 hypothetical protein A1sIA56_00250 [Candidatus Planktophila sulfonica]